MAEIEPITEQEEKDFKILSSFLDQPFVVLYRNNKSDEIRLWSSYETIEAAKKESEYLIRQRNTNAYIFELKEIVRRSFELESIFVKEEKKENEQ